MLGVESWLIALFKELSYAALKHVVHIVTHRHENNKTF